MRFSIWTLGCKTNQFESQAMAKLLTQRGHEEVPTGEPVDAYVINTCSVTAVSDKKSRQTIRAVRKQNPQTIVAVCGCYAQLEPEKIAELEVNLVGGTGNHLDFITELENTYLSNHPEVKTLPYDDPKRRLGIESLPSGGLEGRTRALLKIQDGCNHFCSYCIIPYARGRIRSLPPEEARLAIEDLMTQDYQEIILTGIEISSWGKDLPQQESLVDFLAMANQMAQSYQETEGKEVFFRLGSLEPRTITEEFCSKVSQMNFIRPHFHLSLQSGSDSVLKRMNRKYDTARFEESVTWIRQYFPKAAITTDVIVGFPQETEEEFQETLAFMNRCQFSSMHIFPYSPRDGTPAAKMSGQITKEVKDSRSKEATALAKTMAEAYHQGFLGETLPVLFEAEKEEHRWIGLSPQHIQVKVTSTQGRHNQTHLVKITSHSHSGLEGTLVTS